MTKRVFLSVILLMAAVCLIWSAGQGETKAQKEEAARKVQLLPNSWETFKDQPVTLTAFWDVAREFGDMAKDTALVPTTMRKQTGVTLEIKTAIDNTEQSINLLIASGNLPDFMYVNYERPSARSLVNNGMLYSFDELKKTYGIDMVSRLNINQRFVQRVTFDRDEIYYLNQGGIPPERWNDPWVVRFQTGVMVNKYYYDKVGAPPINSMDDFINVALKAKQEIEKCTYPVNVHRMPASRKGPFGEPSEVWKLLPFYGLTDPSTFNPGDGSSHKFYFQTGAFLDLLKDLNRMWNQQLLAPDIRTAGRGAKTAYFFSGEGMFDMQNDTDNLQWFTSRLKETDPAFSAVMLPDFSAHPDRYSYSAAGQFGIGESRGFTIPKGNKNTLRTLAFLDYLFSDTFQLMNIYGIEGETYVMKDGVPVFTEETKKNFQEHSGDELTAKYGFNYLAGDLRDGYWAMIMRQQNMPQMLEALRGPLAPIIKNFKDITLVPAAQTAGYPSDSEELKYYSNIKQVFGDEIPKIIVGPPDKVEDSYNALMQRLDTLGIAKLNAYQAAHIKKFASLVARYKH